MKVHGKSYRTIWIDRGVLTVINQNKLPHRFEMAELHSISDVCDAIKNMVVRGAGLIGVTAGFGMWIAAKTAPRGNLDDFEKWLSHSAELLKKTRPTAVDLQWAVERQLREIEKGINLEEKIQIAMDTASAICEGSVLSGKKIGEYGKKIIADISKNKAGKPVNILTHCNAGWLAFVDYGSALSPVYAAHDDGILVHVWVDETRPRNQGASLTAWELSMHGVPHSLIVDNAGGHIMQHGMVDMVITGADRITRRGDVANKIGTYLKALAAEDNNIPFYVAAPSSSFDFNLDGIEGILIEERDADEVRLITGETLNGAIETVRICLFETAARNWAFDVTPARFVTKIICEHGICNASEADISELFLGSEQ